MPSRRAPAISLTPASAQPVDFAEAAQTFSLLAAPTRVQLLWVLAQGERDVTSLAEAVDATIAAVSQHLAKLKLADLVTARTQGRRQIYRVEDPHILTLVNQAVEHHTELRLHGRRPGLDRSSLVGASAPLSADSRH